MLNKENENSTSLNKYISSTGKCSRREADVLINEGKVTINGKVAKLGNRVYEGDHVKVGKKLLIKKNYSIYIAFNKPVGIVCTTDLREPDNIISYLNFKERLFPIGRLDKSSQGLIFLTNDGDIVNKILRVGNAHEKEYIVKVNKSITPEFINKMSRGVPILGTRTKPCEVTRLDEFTFKIILVQGLNRQIRRMCEYLGYRAKKLKRVRIMNVTLGKLREGESRRLTHEEMQAINNAISNNSETSNRTHTKKKAKKSGSKPRINFENKKSNASRRVAKASNSNNRPSKRKSSYSSFKKKSKR